MKKELRYILLALLSPICVWAQNGTSSPSSRFGYGEMNDNLPVAYRSLGGISTGMRKNYAINPAQPASYTACDTMTFMMDVAGSVLWTRYEDNIGQHNKANGNLEYVLVQLPLYKQWLAASVGVMPYSTVGYDFVQSGSAGPYDYTVTYTGEGGLTEAYLGVSGNLFNWVALGVNAYYMFGSVNNATALTFSDGGLNSSVMYKMMKVNNFRFRFGAQVFHTFAKEHTVILGAAYEFKKNLKGDYTQYELNTLDSIRLQSSGFETPQYWSVGGSYIWDDRLTIGIDYAVYEWSKAQYFDQAGALRNRGRWAVGVEYRHNRMSRNYAARMYWRAGVNITDSYTKDADKKDLGVSVGVGFPFRTSASMVNLSVEYNRRQSMMDMTENQLRFVVGVAIHEMWFFKRKL